MKALVLIALALVACAPEQPAKVPASCLASCRWGEPKGPDDTGECYCQGYVPSPQCAADEAAGLPCE